MACRYRIECIWGCGWNGIFESRETMFAKAQEHDLKCINSEVAHCNHRADENNMCADCGFCMYDAEPTSG